jgi:hypothetical protein
MMLWNDSFDHYATADLPAKAYSTTGTGSNPNPLAIGAYGRNGTNGARLFQNNENFPQYVTLAALPVSGTVLIIGMDCKVTAGFGYQSVFEVLKSGSDQIAIYLTAGGVFEVRRRGISFGGGTLLGTSATALTAGVSTFVEFKITVATSGGTIVTKFNGVTDANLNLSGLNTAKVGVDGWDQIRFGGSAEPGSGSTDMTLDLEDLYIFDGSGSTHNDFLGDARSLCLFPSTGNGTHAEYAASTGSDHGALVDETTPNDTDYVSSGTVNHRDTYNYPAAGVSGTVAAVTQPLYAKCEAAGVRQLVAICVIGGTTYTHATAQTLGATWFYYRFQWLVNPATSAAWTIAEIDAAEFGHKIAA